MTTVELISVKETSRRLGWGERLVRRMIKESGLPAVRSTTSPRGRLFVLWHKVPAWLSSQSIQPRDPAEGAGPAAPDTPHREEVSV